MTDMKDSRLTNPPEAGVTAPPSEKQAPKDRRRAPGGLASVATRNALASVLARVSGLIVAVILTPFILHRLGRDLYGVAVAAGSAYEYVSLLRGGMGAALRRYVTMHHHASRDEEARRFYATGFWWAGVLRVVVLVVAILVAEPLTRFLRIPDANFADAAMGIALILVSAVILDSAIMLNVPIYATGRTAALSFVQMGTGWLRLAVVVIAFGLLAPSLTVYGGSLILIEGILLVALIWMAQRAQVVGAAIPRPDFGNREIRRQLFSYGGLALLSEAAALLYLSTDMLLIGRFYGPSEVTRYSLGTRWSPMILGFIAASVTSLTPLFTQLEARGELQRSRRALSRVVAATAALAVPACLVPCVVGDLFLVHWVGPEYRGSAVYMIAMLAPSTLDASLTPVWMALMARGRIGWIATGEIITAVGNVALSLFLALTCGLGLLGFALGNTAALLAKNLILRPLASRRDPMMPSLGEFLRPLPRAFLGSAPGLLALFLLRNVYGGGLVQVIVAGVIGFVVCLVGSSLLAVGRSEIRALIKSFSQTPEPGRTVGGGPGGFPFSRSR
jgi:O-antigen/teichoic acid export membrane protein